MASEPTYAITYVTEHWVINWTDGEQAQLPSTSTVNTRPDGLVQFGGFTLKWQNCTSPVVTGPSDLVTKICALNTGIQITSKSGLDIAQGFVEGHSTLSKFGRNPSIDTASTPEDLWSVGGLYNFLTAAATIRVKSGGDAADTNGGAGAQTIFVQGLDSDFNQISDTITLAGASASAATTNQYIRVSRAYVTSCGTYGAANTADIDIETTGGTTVARIPAGSGQTQQVIYTVPAGFTGYLTKLKFSADTNSNRTVSFELYKRENADDVTTPFSPIRAVQLFDGISGIVEVNYGEAPLVFTEKTDVWIRISSVSNNGTAVSGALDGYIVSNSVLP